MILLEYVFEKVISFVSMQDKHKIRITCSNIKKQPSLFIYLINLFFNYYEMSITKFSNFFIEMKLMIKP